MNNIDLKNIFTENFTLQEFANSKDGNRIKLSLVLVFMLQKLRDIVGRIDITSGYRTIPFNDKIGGSKNSNHTKGLAVDIQFDFTIWSKESLIRVFKFLGFKNVGFYWSNGKIGDMDQLRWIHLDIGKPHKGEFCIMDWDTRGKMLNMEGK